MPIGSWEMTLHHGYAQEMAQTDSGGWEEGEWLTSSQHLMESPGKGGWREDRTLQAVCYRSGDETCVGMQKKIQPNKQKKHSKTLRILSVAMYCKSKNWSPRAGGTQNRENLQVHSVLLCDPD